MPPLVIKQGTGENIILPNDVFYLEFNSDLPLAWIGEDQKDEYFTIHIADESRLEMTYIGDSLKTIQEHVLPPFNIKFIKPGFWSGVFGKKKQLDENNLAGNIEFSAGHIPFHDLWYYYYDVIWTSLRSFIGTSL